VEVAFKVTAVIIAAVPREKGEAILGTLAYGLLCNWQFLLEIALCFAEAIHPSILGD
jgi:hypothetical protein